MILKSGCDMKVFAEARPVSNGNWRAFSFVEDYRTSCVAIFEAFSNLICEAHPDDVLLIDEFIERFVKVFPWNSHLLNKNQQLSQRLADQLCASRHVSSSVMTALADLARHVSAETIDMQQVSFLSRNLGCIDSPNRCCLVSSFNYLVSKVTVEAVDFGPLVEEGILLFDPGSQPRSAASFINIALLDSVSREVEERLARYLNQGVLNRQALESILFGLGKASRRSIGNLHTASRILTPVSAKTLSDICHAAPVIQCLGDIVFSAVLLTSDISDNQRSLFSILGSKLYRKQEASVALRAFMTGYSRIIEAETVCNVELLSEIDCVFRIFVENQIADATSDPQMSERFVADLMRSVGLIDKAGVGKWFNGEMVDRQLMNAIKSKRTQIVVGSLVSLRIRIPPLGDIVSDVIDASLMDLELRNVWDYNSAPVVSGVLHVLVEALRTSETTDPTIAHVRRDRIRRLVEFIRSTRIPKHNDSIPKHCESLLSILP